VVKAREALGWTLLWFGLAMLFALVIAPQFIEGWGREETNEFITGYLVELSLSMDNVFVIALIFSYFRVPVQFQHRVLFWGILGALLMRGGLIVVGAALLRQFHWLIYVFGAFLLFTGIKMLFSHEEGVAPEKNWVIRLARQLFPVTPGFEGQRFFTRLDGRLALTPLALVLLTVETTDLVFALDSIPAIFGVTQKEFIVFTSNIFAILGLRSLYFVLASAIRYFHYLKYGLSLVLVFIGVKMLMHPWQEIPTHLSLGIVAGVILSSIVISIVHGARGDRKPPTPPA